MDDNSRPKIITFDGVTGSGKTTLLLNLKKKFPNKFYVGTKLTTREKRNEDNDWEFNFVNKIPKKFQTYSFKSVGNEYAIVYEELKWAISNNLVYAISCVEKTIIKSLKSEFNTLSIYIYRPWEAEELKQFLDFRCLTKSDAQTRSEEIKKIPIDYTQKLQFIDHVILNVSSKKYLIKQLYEILNLYKIIDNSETK